MGSFNREKNRAVWFDVPVKNLERAVEFYKFVLGADVTIEQYEESRFAVIDHEDGNGGCLVEDSSSISGTQGVLVYMNVHGRIRDAIEQVARYNGKILEEIHSIGPHGFRAVVLDSEGNRIALHSDEDA